MEPATWVIGTVVVVALLHLLVVSYLSRRRANAAPFGKRGNPTSDGESSGDGAGESRADIADEDGDTVRCRECGAENERDYRYCRHCVAELPGGSPLEKQPGSPLGVR